MSEASGLFTLLDRGGVLALLSVVIVVITIGGVREWYYLRPYVSLLRERLTERDARIAKLEEANQWLREDATAWRDEAERLAGTAERVLVRPPSPSRRRGEDAAP